MFRGDLSGKALYDPVIEAQNLVGQPVPPGFERANSFSVPLGPAEGHGWLLLRRGDLDTLDLNALHTLTFQFEPESGATQTRKFYNLVVCKEPVNLDNGLTADDPDSVYLVEVADARWRCKNPYYSIAINRAYNVRAQSFQSDCYTYSLNSGSLWTWATMLQDIWEVLTPLGDWPGLPAGATPASSPDGWEFRGVPAYDALNTILQRIGCAIKATLSLTSNQFSIVQVGAADTASDTVLARGTKIHDGEYQSIVRGKVPYGCRVFFHRREKNYGTEETTPKTSTQWQGNAVYSVDITGPDSASAEANTWQPLWSDLPAIYDDSGAITNAAACSASAQECADNFYRLLRSTGGLRLWQRYSGLLNLTSGSTVKGVLWQQGEHGIYTEVVRHPFLFVRATEQGWAEVFEDATRLHSPDFRPTWPNYPHVMQVVKLTTATANGSGLYSCTVQKSQPDSLTWTDGESANALNLRGTPILTNSGRYQARLIGYYSSAPLYAIDDIGPSPTFTDLTVTGDLDVGGDLSVTGDTSLGGTLDVTGDTTLTGTLTAGGVVIFQGGADYQQGLVPLDVVTDVCFTAGLDLVFDTSTTTANSTTKTSVLSTTINLAKATSVTVRFEPLWTANTAVVGDVYSAYLYLDGTEQTQTGAWAPTTTTAKSSGVSYTWTLPMASGTRTIAIKVNRSTDGGGGTGAADLAASKVTIKSQGVLTTQKRKVYIVPGISFNEPLCEDNPAGCCYPQPSSTPSATDCCPDVDLPETIGCQVWMSECYNYLGPAGSPYVDSDGYTYRPVKFTLYWYDTYAAGRAAFADTNSTDEDFGDAGAGYWGKAPLPCGGWIIFYFACDSSVWGVPYWTLWALGSFGANDAANDWPEGGDWAEPSGINYLISEHDGAYTPGVLGVSASAKQAGYLQAFDCDTFTALYFWDFSNYARAATFTNADCMGDPYFHFGAGVANQGLHGLFIRIGAADLPTDCLNSVTDPNPVPDPPPTGDILTACCPDGQPSTLLLALDLQSKNLTTGVSTPIQNFDGVTNPLITLSTNNALGSYLSGSFGGNAWKGSVTLACGERIDFAVRCAGTSASGFQLWMGFNPLWMHTTTGGTLAFNAATGACANGVLSLTFSYNPSLGVLSPPYILVGGCGIAGDTPVFTAAVTG